MVENILKGKSCDQILNDLKKLCYNNKLSIEDRRNALLSSISNNQIEIFSFLLKISDEDVLKQQALRRACYEGNAEIVQLLINDGVDIHNTGEFCLRRTSEYGHVKIVKLLLNAGANVHINVEYPLRFASSNGHLETVKILLDYGADIHALCDEALKWACMNNHIEVARVLLERGADVRSIGHEIYRVCTPKIFRLLVDNLKDE